ncbi:MAG TPA: hypothetical protein VK324_12680 [Tepidisphaeraceae bacterium]|nr:hypothetical protein [Tepidisphaeraceae bacterium]
MDAYSTDLRERVIADCDAGLGTKAAAAKFRVSPAWVRRLKQHRRERGDIVPRNGGGSRGRKIDRDHLGRVGEGDAGRDPGGAAGPAGRVGHPVGSLQGAARAGALLQKSRSAPPSRTARTSPTSGRRGG